MNTFSCDVRLWAAAQQGLTDEVEHCLHAGATFAGTQSALHVAACNNHADIVRALCASGADANGTDPCIVPKMISFNSMHLACKVGSAAAVVALLECKASPLGARNNLHVAATRGHTVIAEALVDAKADVCQLDENGRTALSLAAVHSTPVLDVLLRAGAGGSDAAMLDALSRAVGSSNIEATEKLLQTGVTEKLVQTGSVDVNARVDNLLCCAAHNGSANIVGILLRFKAFVDDVPWMQTTPLIVAIRSEFSRPAVIQLLIAAKADVNRGTERKIGSTVTGSFISPLLAAVETVRHSRHNVRVLLNAKAYCNAVCNPFSASGVSPMTERTTAPVRSPIHVAASDGRDAIMRMLIMAKACLNTVCGGQSLMHAAVAAPNSKAVACLLAARVSANKRDASGRTVMDIARRNAGRDTVRLLLDAKAKYSNR